MKRSIQSTFTSTLTWFAFLAVVLAAWMLTSIDRHHFMEYVEQNQSLRTEHIAEVLALAYERDGGWQKTTGVDVGLLGELEGVQVTLFDAKQEEVWSVGALMPEHVRDQVRYREAVYSGERVVGFVETAYVDPHSFSELDRHYREAMTQGMISTILPMLLLFTGVSWYLSRRLSRPLTEMIGLAGQMREGNLDVRIKKPPGETELRELAESLNHLAESLQKQEALRRTLTGDVAHELRTPLATLKSHLEALSDGVWEATPERLAVCQEEVDRLIGLVASLEKLTQAESRSVETKCEPADLLDASRSVIGLVESSFAQKGVGLSLATEGVDEGVLMLPLDRDQWKQVLLNLLDNALKYTQAGDEVTVTIRQTDRVAEIAVADTGEGIAAEDLPNVFERFYRADKSRSRSTGGAGIGLAIVKRYVQAHGGTITVESRLGEGTTFVVRLPRE